MAIMPNPAESKLSTMQDQFLNIARKRLADLGRSPITRRRSEFCVPYRDKARQIDASIRTIQLAAKHLLHPGGQLPRFQECRPPRSLKVRARLYRIDVIKRFLRLLQNHAFSQHDSAQAVLLLPQGFEAKSPKIAFLRKERAAPSG